MPDPLLQSEWLTRKKHSDTRLAALGWQIIPFDPSAPLSLRHRQAVEEYPTASGPADYALCINGQILGIVEAKKLSLGPQNVLVQAQRYSRSISENALTFGEFHVPFLFSTNGEVIWFHDVRHGLNLSRKIADFMTPAGLEERLAHEFDSACVRLLQLANNHPYLRPYQRDANAAIPVASTRSSFRVGMRSTWRIRSSGFKLDRFLILQPSVPPLKSRLPIEHVPQLVWGWCSIPCPPGCLANSHSSNAITDQGPINPHTSGRLWRRSDRKWGRG